MNPFQWLEKATTFDLGICPIYRRQIFIEARDQQDGKRLWVFQLERTKCWVLGKDGEFYYEPLPSSRTDEFIALTRYESPQIAHDHYLRLVKVMKPLYVH